MGESKFDIEKYTNALDSLIINLEADKERFPSKNVPVFLEEIAGVLRIGEITVSLKRSKYSQGDSGDMTMFTSGNPDPEKLLEFHEDTGDGAHVVYRVYQLKGDAAWTEVEKSKIRVLYKVLFSFMGRTRLMEKVEYLTFYDNEMEIPNLRYFMKYLGEKIKRREISKYIAGYFNIKGFMSIIQNFGGKKVNEIMKTYVHRLNSILADGETVCRIGGDNYAICFLNESFDRIKDYLYCQTVEYDDKTHEKIMIMASAGLYDIPDSCVSPADVMDCISVANNLARKVFNESFLFYDERVLTNLRESKQIENMFSTAITNEEFLVYYQPKVSLRDYSLCGAEALCRWMHEGEIIPPVKFIPIFEQSRAICLLDFYMLEHVCKDLRKWLDDGKEVVKVSVNLSRRHLGDVDLLDKIIGIVDKYDVPHRYIEIELTETTTDVDFKDLKRVVMGLQKAGISTSVDDFGVGYSSINLIRELPWNVLKIDKSFLQASEQSSANNRVMLKHVISMAQEMGIECIVEGVETIEHIRLLKENRCFMAQGFYFSKPLPKSEFEKVICEHTGAVQEKKEMEDVRNVENGVLPDSDEAPAEVAASKVLEKCKAYAFVDGSFNVASSVYGYGGFVVLGDEKYIIQGSGNESDMASMRNVAGEVLGSTAAIKKALELGVDELDLYYDYNGIEKWATGEWKRNKKGTIAYYDFIQSVKDKIRLNFVKVKGHSGIEGNEEADKLAKEACGN